MINIVTNCEYYRRELIISVTKIFILLIVLTITASCAHKPALECTLSLYPQVPTLKGDSPKADLRRLIQHYVVPAESSVNAYRKCIRKSEDR